MKGPTISARDLMHRYGDRTVLDVPEVSFYPGRIYALLGPNGSGKSTLLGVLAMLLTPARGSLTILDRGVASEADREKLRKQVTLLLQRPVLFHKSVQRNIAYGLRARGEAVRNIEPRVRSALELMGLAEFGERNARRLSGGEAQRVALGRALVLETPVLLLDEPMQALEASFRQRLERILVGKAAEGRTVIVATHETEVARRLADEIIHLDEGKQTARERMNQFNGSVDPDSGGRIFISGEARFEIVPPEGEVFRASLDPKNVVLSGDPIATSARNTFKGTVRSVIPMGKKVLVEVASSAAILAEITDLSRVEMGIEPGVMVYASFKSSSLVLS